MPNKMPKELYNMSVSYIKAYYKYKRIADAVYSKACLKDNQINANTAGSCSVRSIKDNRAVDEYVYINDVITKSFPVVIRELEKIERKDIRDSIIKNIADADARYMDFTGSIKPFLAMQFKFIENVAKGLTSNEVFALDKKYRYKVY